MDIVGNGKLGWGQLGTDSETSLSPILSNAKSGKGSVVCAFAARTPFGIP